ncbi:MAG: AbrB family transcriptional regulator [Euryarchaeota archaeon]|nr:AbrB family transcriptional regulator [Euryarchaeota archaeon]
MIKTGEITSLTRASTKGDSLRTTVPSGIVKQFKLEDKGELEWEIVSRANKLVIQVTPL